MKIKTWCRVSLLAVMVGMSSMAQASYIPREQVWDNAADSELLDGHDSTYFQREISSASCSTGIASVADNGTLTCASSQADTDWTESGGNVYRETGNVGIGTTDPGEKLDVVGNAKIGSTLYVDTIQLQGSCCGVGINMNNENLTGVGAFTINDGGYREGFSWGGTGAYVYVSPLDNTNADGYMIFENDGGVAFRGTGPTQTDMVIQQTTGNVGIGTTSPSVKLHLSESDSTSVKVKFQNSNSNFDIKADSGDGEFSNNWWGGDFTFKTKQADGTGNTNQLFLEGSSGNVGIGTTNPEVKLHVVGTGSESLVQIGSYFSMRADGVLDWGGSSMAYGQLSWDTGKVMIGGKSGMDYALLAGGSERMRISSSGSVGIGDTSPDASLKLDVEGQVGATGYCDANGANCKTITELSNTGSDDQTAAEVSAIDEFANSNGTNVQDVLDDLDSAIDTHKYHKFLNDGYYFDNYNQDNYLRLFTETASYDTVRFQPYANVEYWNGSAWTTWSGGDAVIESLLDGREETGSSIDHTHRKFRFEVTRNSGWPTMALIVMQSSWTGLQYPGMQVTVETYDGSTWNVKEVADFDGAHTGNTYGFHVKATTALHDGKVPARVTVDITDWTDSGSYTMIPLRNFMILSNFSGAGDSKEPFTWDYAGELKLKTVQNSGTDTDKFLVSDGGEIRYRTGAQVRSDIGAQPVGSYLTGTKVDSFNSRTGVVTLTSGDVTGALGFTPYNSTNPSGYTNDQTDAEILTAIKTVDGSGSGLDADLLDGHDTSYFQTALGFTPLSTTYLSNKSISNADSADTAGTTTHYLSSGATNKPTGTDHSLLTLSYSNAWSTQMAGDWRTNNWYVRNQNNGAWGSWAKLWHAANDGSASGLDADLLDGHDTGYFQVALGFTPYNSTNPAGYITASSTDTLTNKSGSNLMWTNDAGYITSAGNTQLSEATVEGYIANDVTTNYVPRDNGTKLVTGAIFDNGTNVGIGTSDVTYKLNVGTTTSDFVRSYGGYIGHATANIGGTGDAAYFPEGIYSAKQNWLYGGISMGNGALSAVGTIDTGSGAKKLGDAAVANGDTNSIPTGDQVYDFVIGRGYITSNDDDDDIGIEEDDISVNSAVKIIDFGDGLDVMTDGTDEVNVTVDCVEVTGSSALCDGSDAVNDADSSATNEIQTLGTSGNTITLTDSAAVTAPYATNAGTANKIVSSDTRNTDYEPQDRDKGLYADFRSNSVDGLADGGSYHGVLTFRSYGTSTDMSGGAPIQLAYTSNGNLWTRMGSSGTTWGSWDKQWRAANDGSGSGLDADLLDGHDTGYFQVALGFTPYNSTNPAGYITASSTDTLTNKSGSNLMWTNDAGYISSVSDVWVNTTGDTMTGDLNMSNNSITNIDWSTSDDGSGSGLDADLLDGYDSDVFLRRTFNGYSGDVDSLTSDGWVRITGGATNLPVGANNGQAVLTQRYLDANYGFQLFTDDDAWMYIRARKAGAYNSWYKVWAENNDGPTSGLAAQTAATATALAGNGANCDAGQAPRGVDASGAVESCTDFEEDLSNSAGLAAALSDETGTGKAVFNTHPEFSASGTGNSVDIKGTSGTGHIYWDETNDELVISVN